MGVRRIVVVAIVETAGDQIAGGIEELVTHRGAFVAARTVAFLRFVAGIGEHVGVEKVELEVGLPRRDFDVEVVDGIEAVAGSDGVAVGCGCIRAAHHDQLIAGGTGGRSTAGQAHGRRQEGNKRGGEADERDRRLRGDLLDVHGGGPWMSVKAVCL